MKTPEEWIDLSGIFQRIPVSELTYAKMLVEEIQKDALNDPYDQTTPQRELGIAQSIADNERIRADQLHAEMMKWREKYHEARRYLRQANKGAERNNMVMRLQAQTINEMILETKQ